MAIRSQHPVGASTPSLADILDARTAGGELYERLEGNRLRCVACGHRCLIPEGRRGICKVRFNRAGGLHVPFGYVAGLQCDPTEKKPFFHVYPGSNTLTFGMLGCDLHCSYCFPAETPVVTDRGVIPIHQAFEMGGRRLHLGDGDVSDPQELQAVTSDGGRLPVRQVFRRPYTGPLTVIRPYYFPPLRCTPNHKIYVCADPESGAIEPVEADQITPEHYLVIPKRYAFLPGSSLNWDTFLRFTGPLFHLRGRFKDAGFHRPRLSIHWPGIRLKPCADDIAKRPIFTWSPSARSHLSPSPDMFIIWRLSGSTIIWPDTFWSRIVKTG